MKAYFKDGPRAEELIEVPEPAPLTIYVHVPYDPEFPPIDLNCGVYRFIGINYVDMAVYAYEGEL